MKKHYSKSSLFKAGGLLLFAIIVFVIHSCRKDIPGVLDLNDPEIIQAKAWYESTYPQNAVKVNTSPVSSMSIGSTQQPTDLSQIIKPDWQHNSSYVRLNKNVIEMPVDPSSKFSAGFSGGNIAYKKEYSRSYFLLLKDTKQYQAYVMTVMADSAYVNNDLSKLSHNTYSKHDADFTGIVLYFTPKGKFLKSWGYKNGKVLPAAGTATSSQQTQSANARTTFTETAPYTLDCTYYFWDITEDGVLISRTYLYKICIDNGGGGGDGGSSSPTSPPIPCLIDTNKTVVSVGKITVTGSHAPVTGDPGPDDGGFPPPPPVTTVTPLNCTETDTAAVAKIIDSLLKRNFPCATKLIIDSLAKIAKYAALVAPFQTNGIPNLDWKNDSLPWDIIDSTGASTTQLGSTNTIGNSYNATISLNTSMLQNSSQLLIAGASIHETLHGVINYICKWPAMM